MPYKPNPEARGVSRKTDREGLAALRALHVDPSYAVTKSAMIDEGSDLSNTSFGRGKYGLGSVNQSTHIMPGGPVLGRR
jgi:hypothetical protein